MLTLPFFTLVCLAKAQTITVKSESLELLQGVNILNLTDQTGTFTDSRGEANLSSWSDTFIQLSLLGYKTQELSFEGKSLLVIMQRDTKSLSDIVVEGFLNNSMLNNQSGSISKIDAMTLNRFDDTNLTNAINLVLEFVLSRGQWLAIEFPLEVLLFDLLLVLEMLRCIGMVRLSLNQEETPF